MNDHAVPENLKKYSPEILAGIAAADRRRIELANAWGYTTSRENFTACRPAAFAAQPVPVLEPALPSQNASHAAAVGLQAVKFWPMMGISAATHGKFGAWQVWALAKSLDRPGRGAIPLADLLTMFNDLDLHIRTWQRWLAAARGLGLIHDRGSGDGWIVLAGHAAAAHLLGCEDVGARPASIRADDLTGLGARDYIWAAYEATHGGRPISRRKQQQLTGVPISTQRYHDNRAGVIRRPHYAKSDMPADQLDGVKEFEHPGAFIFRDKKRRACVAWRTPDTRSTSAAESLQRGRSRKIRKALARLDSQRLSDSFKMQRVQSEDVGNGQAWRLFHMTGLQLRSTMRKLAKSDLQPRELYLHLRYGWRADFWQVYPMGGVAV